MRVLWVDAEENPWSDSNGWRVLEDFGLRVNRVASVVAAQKLLPAKDYELILVRAEIPGAPSLLVQARRLLGNDGRKLVLASSEWSKEQFRHHAKTEGAAHRYASVPMPPEGFLSMLADLFGCTVDELADFDLPSMEAEAKEEAARSEPPPARPPVPSPSPAKRKRNPDAADGDLDVLRKYLSIREEQLGIAEAERDELVRENDRAQKEAHSLQLRLRDMEHSQVELEKKLMQAEEGLAAAELQVATTREEGEREAKSNLDRMRALEGQVSEAGERYESLRVRVRKDIRKIRENERDLEARLELMRKDSETLLGARDAKVLELQRKIDALEFDLDQIQDGRVQAQMEAERYLAKLSRVSRALHIANSMIEDERAGDAELEELEPFAGGAANAEDAPLEERESSAESPGAGAEIPPADAELPAEELHLSSDIEALANDGEPTQMVDISQLKAASGESGEAEG